MKALAGMLVIALAGCATPAIMLKNDSTGQIARCGGGTAGSVAGGVIGAVDRINTTRSTPVITMLRAVA